MPGTKRKEPFAFGKSFELPSFLRDDAFALGGAMVGDRIPLDRAESEFKGDRSVFRRKCLVLAVLCILLTFASLCLSYSGSGSVTLQVYAPWDVASNIWTWVVYQVSGLLGVQAFDSNASINDVAPLAADIGKRAGMTLVTLVCGALLSVAGMLYQTVFRNPIASPSLLGVTHGVQCGFLFIFGMYGISALAMLPERFIFGYIGGVATLVVVFLLAKLITRRKTSVSVFDLLVVGTIMSAFLGAYRKYLLDGLSALNLWASFFEYQQGLDIFGDPLTYAVLAVATIVSFVPIFLLRYRLNLLSFSDGEIRVMGSNPQALRILAIVSGSIMILTAQIFIGSASSFALVIPFLARYLFGSEFRGQLWGNVFLGMLVLLVCRDLVAVVPFAGVGLPLGAVAGAITLPVFIWATMFTKDRW